VHLRDIRPVPADWAETQNNLGKAYAELTTGDRTANLQKAIDLYEAALPVSTEKDFPVAWAETQNNLGIAYAELPPETVPRICKRRSISTKRRCE
jgi:hypothetical protein